MDTVEKSWLSRRARVYKDSTVVPENRSLYRKDGEYIQGQTYVKLKDHHLNRVHVQDG